MKTFGWTRPTRSDDGHIVGAVDSPVRVRTLEELGHSFGSDHDKRLVVTALAGDMLAMRPERTGRTVMVKAVDVYRWALRCQANVAVLERARERKARKAQRLANARQERAERRLRRPL